MSKRLSVYFAEIGEGKTRLLNDQAVERVRQAHELMATGQARNFKVAVQMVLGTYLDAVPPESVRTFERRLERMEDVQTQTLVKVNELVNLIESAVTRPDVA